METFIIDVGRGMVMAMVIPIMIGCLYQSLHEFADEIIVRMHGFRESGIWNAMVLSKLQNHAFHVHHFFVVNVNLTRHPPIS